MIRIIAGKREAFSKAVFENQTSKKTFNFWESHICWISCADTIVDFYNKLGEIPQNLKHFVEEV